MPTTNLGLKTISPSDNVSPDPINANMEALDKLGLEYVTAQGTSGIWRYRRWKSGTFECWGRYRQQSASPTIEETDFGQFSTSFPITFTESPVIEVSARQDGNVHIYVSYVENSTTKAEWYVGGMFDTVDLECNIYAIGRVS